MTLVTAAVPLHLGPGAGRQLRAITDLVTIKATPADTQDACLLLETMTPPAGGCPPHAQRYDDEAFYILEGTYTFLVGEHRLQARPGTYIYVPRGTVHAYANAGPGPARMLVTITPGGVHERWLDEIGDAPDRPGWEPDMARVLAVAPKYGIEFIDPAAGNHQRER
jgi:quercetin dioxygenase-like cupin family protein